MTVHAVPSVASGGVAAALIREGIPPDAVARALDALEAILWDDYADSAENALLGEWESIALAMPDVPCAGCGRRVIGPMLAWYEGGQVVADCGLCWT